MEVKQQREWEEAQKLAVSVDLVHAAKRQLHFLATVDRNRHLYEGPALERAIYRYNAYWLPLLAKHSETPLREGPLVVPLDCEWIWHCHRLNPVRYISDCKELFGRILDVSNVVSSVQEYSNKEHTEEIWTRLYPEEPYELDFTKDLPIYYLQGEKITKYDLVSAVKRQVPFSYQVSRPHMCSDLFLQEATARYKGFLHLIKRNKENSVSQFCVPTYDVDLIWHSHQLHPFSYSNDLTKILGKVLEHDDTDSDRSKGKKLDVGFSGTIQQWEETFGTRYWKAGAMYRGAAPNPVVNTPCPFNSVQKKLDESYEHLKLVHLPKVMAIEVFLEFVRVKNVPESHKGSIFVLFSKKHPDTFFNVKRRSSVQSVSGEKQVASFVCEPNGELLFELLSHSSSNMPKLKSFKSMGSASLSLKELLDPVSKLSVEKWIEMVPKSHTGDTKPILLHVAVSFSIPTPAPKMLHMLQPRLFSKSGCFFPVPNKIQHTKSWTSIVGDDGNDVINLRLRDLSRERNKTDLAPRMEVTGITATGETLPLAELVEETWFFKGFRCSFKFQKRCGNGAHLFELVGDKMVKLYAGRKLKYEPKHHHNGKQRSEQDFVTAVEFSSEDPYGKAVALFDLRAGTFMVEDGWMVMPAIISAFIFSKILRQEGYNAFSVTKNEQGNREGTTTETKGLLVNGRVGNMVNSGGFGDYIAGGGCGGGVRWWL